MNKTTILFALAVFVCANAFPAVWYVDKDNAGTENGTSWATAFNTIQEGINAAYADGGGEVWVAEGTYTGTGDPSEPVLSLDDDVHVYGGFTGTETSRAQRDCRTHVTVIDGENTRSCVAASVEVGTLDGFTITRGWGVQDPEIQGGGMTCGDPHDIVYPRAVTVSNCTFLENTSEDSAAMYITRYSQAVVSDCTFSNNLALDGTAGVCIEGPGSPLFRRCSFSGNNGAMWMDPGASGWVLNCVFVGNTESAISLLAGSQTLIANCVFYGNTATGGGGAMSLEAGAGPTIINCIFWNNSWGEILHGDPGEPGNITYCNIRGGHPGEGNIDQEPLFVNAASGDFRLLSSSPCIDSGGDIDSEL